LEKSKVLFRVDGDAHIGLGHLVRCIALANMLCGKFEITFFCQAIPQNIINELEEHSFKLITIADEFEFFNEITSRDVIVLDGYQFNIDYQKKITQTGARLVCIDDLHNTEFVAHLIINHAPGVFPADYTAQPYTGFALGLDYVLLRPLFLQQARQTQVARNKDTVLICFGGSDPQNLTKKTLEIVLKVNTFKKIIVIVGAAYVFENTINDLIKNNLHIGYHKAISESEMLDLMLKSDLAIVPASGILFETMTTGCNIIAGCYIDNQKILYNKLKSIGAFVAAGSFKSNEVEEAIDDFLMHNHQPLKLISGMSGKNILYCFNYMLSSLRNVESNDSELLFNWANDPTVRAYAFNSNPIKLEDHENWFNNKLKDDNCYMYILTLQGLDVGQIRFDVLDGIATISYLIEEKHRGQNLGMLIIEKAISLIRSEKNVHTLKALVKPENEASVKIFNRLNFAQTSENYQEHHNIYAFTLVL
jgi:UDP-2,4-diacetamido-2,4,6-trideoxy-beta-L-altropyranose hydrolase